MRLNRHALSAIRQRSGLTKSEFARALEVSPPHVTDLEAGRRQPSPALLLRMAGVLKVPVTALLADPEQAA